MIKSSSKFWVTGGAGFLGSNMIRKLNEKGISNIVLVDDVTTKKLANVRDLKICDLFSISDFATKIKQGGVPTRKDYILHFGADSSTQSDESVLKNNFEFSKDLVCWGQKAKIYFASSAGVYGKEAWKVREDQKFSPLTLYAYSKAVFDQWIASKSRLDINWCGFRIFNCWGPHEESKPLGQINPFYRYYLSGKQDGTISVLSGHDGFERDAVTHCRDFIYVDDAIDMMWFLIEQNQSGFYNIGSGDSFTFDAVAKYIKSDLDFSKKEGQEPINIAYRRFPDHLKGKIQPYTQADITKIRKAGFRSATLTLPQAWHKFKIYLEGKNNE